MNYVLYVGVLNIICAVHICNNNEYVLCSFIGTEYRALFISTNECITDGVCANPIKSICDRYVFNTALTRAKSLVVCCGNPFKLLKIQSLMEKKYGNAGKCWSEYIKRCIECKTFYVPPNMHSYKEAIQILQSLIFDDEHLVFTTELHLAYDSIIDSYTREFESIQHVRNACLTIARINQQSDNVTWAFTSHRNLSTKKLPLECGLFMDTYECYLSLLNSGEGIASPLDPNKSVVKISSYNNRKGAFDGDRVLIGIFKTDPCIGKVIKVLNRSQSLFISQVDPTNPILFKPIKKADPRFINLPKLSRALLEMGNPELINNGLHSTEVVVFEKDWDGCSLPKIADVIPLCVAKDLLFVVRYLCWKSEYRLPLGLVVGVIPQGITQFHAQRLLKMQYNVVGYKNYNITNDHIALKYDSPLISTERIFTIDPENAKILDDALSLKKLVTNNYDSQYELGVHIVNAAKHIPSNTMAYKEAQRRSESFYGTTGQAPMLDDNITSSLSLTPCKTRDVISVTAVITIKSDGSIYSENPTVQMKQITSILQLSYGDAQTVIRGKTPDSLMVQIAQFNRLKPTLEECLKVMYHISLKMREDRIGLAAACSYGVSEESEECNWQAHLLVEELMIWANRTIARLLHEKVTHRSIFRKQNPPNREKLIEIISQLGKVLGHSSSLGVLLDGSVELEDFQIPSFVIHQYKYALMERNLPLLAHLITSEYLYPQLSVACTKVNAISSPAEYFIPSPSESCDHYGLQLPFYTTITSPLRRFIDIYVQKDIIDVLTDCYDMEAENDDGNKAVCDLLNMRAKQAKYFQKNMKEMTFAFELLSQSMEFNAVVCDSSKTSISLCYPHKKLKECLFNCKHFQLCHLRGAIALDEQYVWKARIMSFDSCESVINSIELSDYLGTEYETRDSQELRDGNYISISHYRPKGENLEQHYEETKVMWKFAPSVVTINPDTWRKILTLGQQIAMNPAIECNCNEIDKIISSAELQFATTKAPLADVKCHDSPFIMYELHRQFCQYDLLKVWISWSLHNCVIVPCLQLIELSPDFKICLQHNECPAECFSNASIVQASKSEYKDMHEYVSLWQHVVVAEGSENSVKKDGQINIIKDALLDWPTLTMPPDCFDETYYQTNAFIQMTIPEVYTKKTNSFFKIKEGDLVCARYGTKSDSNTKAVFHMVVVNVNKEKESHNKRESIIKSIELVIMGQMRSRISDVMKKVLSHSCELQIIPMAVSYR